MWIKIDQDGQLKTSDVSVEVKDMDRWQGAGWVRYEPSKDKQPVVKMHRNEFPIRKSHINSTTPYQVKWVVIIYCSHMDRATQYGTANWVNMANFRTLTEAKKFAINKAIEFQDIHNAYECNGNPCSADAVLDIENLTLNKKSDLRQEA
jgi:hypothetical protein